MERDSRIYQTYVRILEEELIPAFGCTEPIALALASAVAREALGAYPVRVKACLSGNIIKNVKSVTVPNTGGQKGIEAAVAAGIIAGNASRELEVIAEVSGEKIQEIRSFLGSTPIEVQLLDTPHILDIYITVWGNDGSSAGVRIRDAHTNVVCVEKNGSIVWEKPSGIRDKAPVDLPVIPEEQPEELCSTLRTAAEVNKLPFEPLMGNFAVGAERELINNSQQVPDRTLMNVKDILDFARTVRLSDVEELIERQMSYNMAIAQEGLKGDYGANIGRVLLKTYGDDVKVRAKAYAAAGSDARMSGCSLPVVIVSGSGNQGITASVPVMVYGGELKADREQLIRAVLLSDLITIHLKTGIGKLSAYCGAVSAGSGSGAGIAFLNGGGYEEISHTIVNSLAIVSGVICDGAKASCAAKIAIAVEAGIMGYSMYREGQEFKAGDGIVTKGIEANIENIGQLAQIGMRETDKEILHLMVEC